MIKKTIRIVLLIALILVLLLAVLIVLGAVLRDEMLLSPWGTGFFVIASGSMEPNIPSGSIVLVTAVAQEEIAVGDVLTFFSTSKTEVITHRVVAVSGGGEDYFVTTRGDANNTDDRPLSYDRVIGRVSYIVPGSSFIIVLLGNATYAGIAIIGVGVVLFLSGVLVSVKKRKKEKQEIPEIIGSNEVVQEVDSNEDKVGFKSVMEEVDSYETGVDIDLMMKEVDSYIAGVDIDSMMREVDSSKDEVDFDRVIKEVDSDEVDFEDER